MWSKAVTTWYFKRRFLQKVVPKLTVDFHIFWKKCLLWTREKLVFSFSKCNWKEAVSSTELFAYQIELNETCQEHPDLKSRNCAIVLNGLQQRPNRVECLKEESENLVWALWLSLSGIHNGTRLITFNFPVGTVLSNTRLTYFARNRRTY